MKDSELLVMNGFYYNGYTNERNLSFKIIAILDERQLFFKGIGLSSSDCNLSDENEILRYIGENYKDASKFSLIAGYYDPLHIQYTNCFHDRKITFGSFELDESSNLYIGKERSSQNGRLKRDSERQINQYEEPVKTNDFPNLYEAVETVLTFEQDNLKWQGIQYSVESMVPSNRKSY